MGARGCLFFLVMSWFGFAGAYMQDPLIPYEGSSLMGVAKDDFHAYCTGTKGWHNLLGVNIIALAEWLEVGCLMGSVLVATADLDAHQGVLPAIPRGDS